MQSAQGAGRSISSAAIRMIPQCRWITSYGSCGTSERVILVDTGFDAAMAAKRKRTLVREPRDGLALLGVKATDVGRRYHAYA